MRVLLGTFAGMRFLGCIVLVAILLSQMFSKTIIYLAFKANQEYIAQNLCENRAHPQMHCNGKCHLAKQLNEAEKQAPQLPASSGNSEEQFFTGENGQAIFVFAFKRNTVSYAGLSTAILPANASAVFHPPCRIA